jgi:hypothetical protein
LSRSTQESGLAQKAEKEENRRIITYAAFVAFCHISELSISTFCPSLNFFSLLFSHLFFSSLFSILQGRQASWRRFPMPCEFKTPYQDNRTLFLILAALFILINCLNQEIYYSPR